jgi:hypothetical protein
MLASISCPNPIISHSGAGTGAGRHWCCTVCASRGVYCTATVVHSAWGGTTSLMRIQMTRALSCRKNGRTRATSTDSCTQASHARDVG